MNQAVRDAAFFELTKAFFGEQYASRAREKLTEEQKQELDELIRRYRESSTNDSRSD